jgi:hypothetical protein
MLSRNAVQNKDALSFEDYMEVMQFHFLSTQVPAAAPTVEVPATVPTLKFLRIVHK